MKLKLVAKVKTSVIGLDSFIGRMIDKYPEIEVEVIVTYKELDLSTR